MEPLVLRCRILAPYVPLRATSSKSVPGVDIVYIAQRSVTKTEFRNCLLELINLKGAGIYEYISQGFFMGRRHRSKPV